MSRSARFVRAHKRFRQFFVEQLEDRAMLAATITVNSVADINARDDALTLREAILINNRTLDVALLTAAEQVYVSGTPTSADTDTIAFNIPGQGMQTISPASSLAAITEPVIIDGYTQPGAVPNSDPDGFNGTLLIELKRPPAAPLSYVLSLVTDNSLVRGLVINGAAPAPAISVSGSTNVIQGNFLGTGWGWQR
jgi:hypothetical protein